MALRQWRVGIANCNILKKCHYRDTFAFQSKVDQSTYAARQETSPRILITGVALIHLNAYGVNLPKFSS